MCHLLLRWEAGRRASLLRGSKIYMVRKLVASDAVGTEHHDRPQHEGGPIVGCACHGRKL